MADIEKKWYVLRAITGKENKIKEYIELDMRNRGYDKYVTQVLIPTKKTEVTLRNKRVIKDVNILPGYVLVEAALVNDIPHLLRYTPNVLGFLGGQDKPTPLRPNEIKRMLGINVEEMETADVVTANYIEGESIKVTDGAFSGFVGTIEEVNNDKKKLKVSVKIFGRVTPLELSFGQVVRE